MEDASQVTWRTVQSGIIQRKVRTHTDTSSTNFETIINIPYNIVRDSRKNRKKLCHCTPKTVLLYHQRWERNVDMVNEQSFVLVQKLLHLFIFWVEGIGQHRTRWEIFDCTVFYCIELFDDLSLCLMTVNRSRPVQWTPVPGFLTVKISSFLSWLYSLDQETTHTDLKGL